MARKGWHQIKGKWARSLGERGLRVRLFQRTKGGVFHRAAWAAGGFDRCSLNTRDRDEAERLGKALLAKLGRTGSDRASLVRLTLRALWDKYRTTCPSYLDNSDTERRDTEARAEILLAHFGDGCVVRDLTADDVAVYAAARKTGGIRVSDTWTTKPVRARSASADVAVLNSMLNWARQTRSDGMRLLDANPLSGVRCPRNTDPRRPLASWERFTATRQAMQELAGQADSDAERFQWVRVELAVVLAEATGRRLGSIRNLQWQDVDWEHRTIRWRREHDKKRRESIVPMPERLVTELRQFQRQLGAVGGWIFASDHDATVPLDRHVFAKWLLRAEKRAKLPKLDGSLWHAFRRKWATERKNLPLTDVAAAGGWQNTATLLTCYQQPTNDGLLAVMSEETKVRDVAVNAH